MSCTTSATGAPVSSTSCCGAAEHAVRMAGRGPDDVEAEQLAVDQRHRRRWCASGDTPPIEKPVLRLHEIGIGAAQRPGDRGHALFVDAPVARGDDQHRRIVGLAAEDHALGDLAHD
jgi:hypothetical protein